MLPHSFNRGPTQFPRMQHLDWKQLLLYLPLCGICWQILILEWQHHYSVFIQVYQDKQPLIHVDKESLKMFCCSFQHAVAKSLLALIQNQSEIQSTFSRDHQGPEKHQAEKQIISLHYFPTSRRGHEKQSSSTSCSLSPKAKYNLILGRVWTSEDYHPFQTFQLYSLLVFEEHLFVSFTNFCCLSPFGAEDDRPAVSVSHFSVTQPQNAVQKSKTLSHIK